VQRYGFFLNLQAIHKKTREKQEKNNKTHRKHSAFTENTVL